MLKPEITLPREIYPGKRNTGSEGTRNFTSSKETLGKNIRRRLIERARRLELFSEELVLKRVNAEINPENSPRMVPDLTFGVNGIRKRVPDVIIIDGRPVQAIRSVEVSLEDYFELGPVAESAIEAEISRRDAERRVIPYDKVDLSKYTPYPRTS